MDEGPTIPFWSFPRRWWSLWWHLTPSPPCPTRPTISSECTALSLIIYGISGCYYHPHSHPKCFPCGNKTFALLLLLNLGCHGEPEPIEQDCPSRCSLTRRGFPSRGTVAHQSLRPPSSHLQDLSGSSSFPLLLLLSVGPCLCFWLKRNGGGAAV